MTTEKLFAIQWCLFMGRPIYRAYRHTGSGIPYLLCLNGDNIVRDLWGNIIISCDNYTTTGPNTINWSKQWTHWPNPPLRQCWNVLSAWHLVPWRSFTDQISSSAISSSHYLGTKTTRKYLTWLQRWNVCANQNAPSSQPAQRSLASNPALRCFYCGRVGHFQSQCRKRKREEELQPSTITSQTPQDSRLQQRN